MAGISFFTPVEYGNQVTSFGERLTEAVDGYFYLGGRVAVIIPGMVRNGSQEVSIQNNDTVWWKTALKVLSYMTVILPVILLIAKAVLRSSFVFHNCQNQIVPEPRPRPPFNPHGEMMVKAPLTLVRSASPTDLKISVLYNERFVPQDPIVPAPTGIEEEGGVSKYTWKVQSNSDGTMNVNDRRIHMIWWEAMRKGAFSPVDPTRSVCVSKGEIREFLEGVLKKQGVAQGELNAFANYWHELLKREEAPYFLVQPVSPSEQGKYLPEMRVDGEKAALFSLNRFYFRFEPVFDAACGMRPEAYLNRVDQRELGANAVIDLGGEVAGQLNAEIDLAFNDAFIRKYIYAN